MGLLLQVERKQICEMIPATSVSNLLDTSGSIQPAATKKRIVPVID